MPTPMSRTPWAAAAFALLGACASHPSRAIVDEHLPALGHRNWILVVDAAYPQQTAPGIETVVVGGDHLASVRDVLESIDAHLHVQPVVFLDAELAAVSERDAAGIGEVRDRLGKLLEGRPVARLPHEKLIAKVDEDAKSYRVLVLKSSLALPYTSVFFRLECGYWNEEAEKRVRERLK